MTSPSPDRLEKMEELLSHQQRLIEQLNDVVIDLRAELDAVRLSQAKCEVTVQWLAENQKSGEALPNEKPPHY